MGDVRAAAAEALAAGKLIVYPTDTLLGLGAAATEAAAVDALLAAKGRPSGMPISVAVSSLEEVELLVDWDDPARAIARRLLPGPVTLLARASAGARRRLAPHLLGPDGSIGIRVPDHPVAREIARTAGPITATSANRHGEPPCRTVPEARRVFGAQVAAYVTEGPAPSGRPSALVDLRGRIPRVVTRG
ncbi:MAG TPA: L-threonylcarbamoyladenylate synthase [Thermoplasmata archaeon]|nr:L-threonylcarbamoyladenylate synthase [Thermoplasmata archaeon]